MLDAPRARLRILFVRPVLAGETQILLVTGPFIGRRTRPLTFCKMHLTHAEDRGYVANGGLARVHPSCARLQHTFWRIGRAPLWRVEMKQLKKPYTFIIAIQYMSGAIAIRSLLQRALHRAPVHT